MSSRRTAPLFAALVLLASRASLEAVCTPTVQWEWDGFTEAPAWQDTCVTPLVLQLTDDNSDGRIDASDGPDVVFNSCQSTITHTCHLIALDGKTGSEHFRVSWTTHGSALLGADIDLDGIAEIVAFNGSRNKLLAFEHDGSLKWESSALSFMTTSYDTIGSADFDQDGVPEIYIAGVLFDAGGTELWRGTAATGRDSVMRTQITHALDLDPVSPGLELLAGTTLYDASGTIIWDRSSELGDGWTAVADFDGDDDPEIVLASDGKLTLLDHLGVRLAPDHVLTPPLSQPLVADVDGDGAPEVVITDGTVIQALDWTGSAFSVRWQNAVADDSRQNGASAYDFDGDGAFEVIYHDEDNWFIFDGDTGASISTLRFDSATGIEVPVVANIDDDSAPEILVTGCVGGFDGRPAVIAYECACSVPARGIWNQYSYHVTNVADDATIPTFETPPWSANNSWLAQVADPTGIGPGPIADAGEDVEVCAGQMVTLDGSNSTACDSTGLEYRWLADTTVVCPLGPTAQCDVTPAVTTTYRLEVVCVGKPSLCAEDSDEVAVVVRADPVPRAIGNSLLMLKSLPDGIDSRWIDLPGPVGDYELLALPAPLGPPTAAAMHGALVKARAASGATPLHDLTGMTEPPDALVFWRVRGTSPCAGRPGPNL